MLHHTDICPPGTGTSRRHVENVVYFFRKRIPSSTSCFVQAGNYAGTICTATTGFHKQATDHLLESGCPRISLAGNDQQIMAKRYCFHERTCKYASWSRHL